MWKKVILFVHTSNFFPQLTWFMSLEFLLLGKCNRCHISVASNTSSRKHTQILLWSQALHIHLYEYMSTYVFKCLSLDTTQERKRVSGTIRRSWACLWSSVICAEGEQRPGKRTQAPSPSWDHPLTFGLVFSVFCHGEPYPGILQAFHDFFVYFYVSPTQYYFLWALSSCILSPSSPWDDISSFL